MIDNDDDLVFYSPFNIIYVMISWILPLAGLEPRTPDLRSGAITTAMLTLLMMTGWQALCAKEQSINRKKKKIQPA